MVKAAIGAGKDVYSEWPLTTSNEQLLPEVIAKLIGTTGGNFRLLTRILAQIERVLVNQLCTISTEVVEAARDSLVIGQG